MMGAPFFLVVRLLLDRSVSCFLLRRVVHLLMDTLRDADDFSPALSVTVNVTVNDPLAA